MLKRLRTIAPVVLLSLAATGVATAFSASRAAVHTGTAYAVAPYKVKGTIGVSENDASRVVTVKLDLTGFTPNTRHVMHVHKGLMCKAMENNTMPPMSKSMGKILIPLGVHKSDSHGDMRLSIRVKKAPKLDFGHIHVMVHEGPSITAKPLWASPVTCADIP